MPLMAHGPQFIEWYVRHGCPQSLKALDRLNSSVTADAGFGDQSGNRSSVARDDDSLSTLNIVEKLR